MDMNVFASLPPGVEVYLSHGDVVTLEEHIENIECVTFDADEAMAAASTFIKAGIAGATAGGIILAPADLQALSCILDLVKGRTAAAREAASAMALSPHAW